MFPTDLFTKLSVYKSPTAAMLEGGAAGVVDMRTARPFDKPGRNILVNVAGVENTVADKWGNKGSILASQTYGTEFGILGGFAWAQNKIRTTGFETIGWTNANLSATQSTATNRNNTGGGNWTIPGTVPVNAGNGLTSGAPSTRRSSSPTTPAARSSRSTTPSSRASAAPCRGGHEEPLQRRARASSGARAPRGTSTSTRSPARRRTTWSAWT
jgi:hypothetical protein